MLFTLHEVTSLCFSSCCFTTTVIQTLSNTAFPSTTLSLCHFVALCYFLALCYCFCLLAESYETVNQCQGQCPCKVNINKFLVSVASYAFRTDIATQLTRLKTMASFETGSISAGKRYTVLTLCNSNRASFAPVTCA